MQARPAPPKSQTEDLLTKTRCTGILAPRLANTLARRRSGNHFVLGLGGVPLEKLAEGLPAVAQRCFLLRCYFCKSLAERWKIEERVITKSAAAAQFAQDGPIYLSAKAGHGAPVPRHGDAAYECGPALALFHLRH